MKKFVVVLGAAVLVAGGVATHLWQGLRAEREQAGELAARVAAMESAQLARASMPHAPETVTPPALTGTAATGTVVAATAPAASPRAAAVPTAPTPAPGEVAARQPPAVDAAGPPQGGLLEAMQSPQGRDFTRSMMRGLMGQMYPDVAKELDLSPEQVGKLFDLLAKQQGDLGMESMGLLAGGPQDPAARQDMQRKLVEQQRAHEAELTTLLGSKYPKWEEYQGTAAARQQVDQLRTTLSASGNPLSEAQSKSLTTVFAAEQTRLQQQERDWMASAAALSSPNMMQEQLQRVMDSQRRLVDVAAPHLDSGQVDQYRRQVEQQVSMMRATMGLIGGQGSKP